MDGSLGAPPGSDTPRDGCDALLVETLSLLLPLLPLDARACAACVCRAWHAATSHPALWEVLSFKHCAAPVDDATLASLCERAGANLRTLRLAPSSCCRVTAAGLLAALRQGGCTGVVDIVALFRRLQPHEPPKLPRAELEFLVGDVLQLASAYPALRRTKCTVSCPGTADVATLLASMVAGPLTLLVHDSALSTLDIHRLLLDPRVAVAVILRTPAVHALGDPCAAAFGDGLRLNRALTALELSRLAIGVAGMSALGEALLVNATLKSLNLSHNVLGDAGATVLGQALLSNSTLTALDLCWNEIGDDGVVSLSKVLGRRSSSLKVLSLHDNDIGDTGAFALAAELRENSTLTALCLGYNMIGDDGATALEEAQPRTALTLLDLDENPPT